MSYDGKNAYPETPVDGNTYGKFIEGSLKDRALQNLKVCKRDMDKLQNDRAKYQKYYMAEKLGNEIEGRSQVVMSDVQDTIESLMPSMMRIFYSGTEVLNIRPNGPEDELKAKLMEQKVNFDVQKQNEGFKVIYSFIKDALLFKTGIIKYRWEKKEEYGKEEEYENLDEATFLTLRLGDKYKVEKVKYKAVKVGGVIEELDEAPKVPDPLTMEYRFDVTVKKIKRISRPVIENVPAEEFIYDIKARHIKKAFCAHKKRVHKKKMIRDYKLDESEVDKTFERSTDIVKESRFEDLGGLDFIHDPKDANYVYIYECYLFDFDEEGEEVPKIVTIFADKVIKIQDNSYGRPPFVVMSPVLMTHRATGRSIAELVVEIQKLNTSLMRYTLDNIYFQNNGMSVVNPYRIDMDTMKAANRPGGMALTKFDINPNEAIMPMPIKPLPPHTLEMFELVQMMKENRTGVTRYNQGLDAKSLNRTATGVSIISSAAQSRMELIARIFAETGMRDLYKALVDMNIDYFDQETLVKVNKGWMKIRPEDIDGDFDVIIDVGVTGSKEMAFNQKVQMLNLYGMMFKMLGPMSKGIFDLVNVKNIIKGMWEDQGYKNMDEYLASEQETQQIMMMMAQQMMMGGPPQHGQRPQGPHGHQGLPGGGGPQAAGPPAGPPVHGAMAGPMA